MACAACVLAACVAGASCFWLSDAPFIVGESAALHLPLLSHWGNTSTIFSREFTAFSDGQYRPLSYALLAAARTFVSADNARFWQVWLLAFHVLNAILLHAVVRRLTGSLWGAEVAAFVFALHPLAGVVVHRVVHFHYSLGLAFCLGSFLSHLRREGASRPSVVSVLLFACALLTTKAALGLLVALGVGVALRRAHQELPRRDEHQLHRHAAAEVQCLFFGNPVFRNRISLRLSRSGQILCQTPFPSVT